MDEILRFFAREKGMALAEGGDLSLQFGSFPSGGRGLLVVLGILAVVAIVLFAYARDAHRLSRGKRIVLTGLRVIAILIACVLLLDPQLVAVRREVRPGQTLVLIDGSQSMAQVDGFRAPEVQALASSWRECGAKDTGTLSRKDLARDLLSKDDGALLAGLQRHNRVLVYSFAAGLDPLAALDLRAEDEATKNTAVAKPQPQAKGEQGSVPDRFDPASLRADGTYTNLGGAVREALARNANANVAGVVLLSDGRRNLGAQGAEVARLLRNRAVPKTIVLPVGDPSPVRTVRLTRFDAPEKVFQKDPFTLRAYVEGEGYDDALVTAHLVRRADDGKGPPETLRTEQVHVARGQPEVEIAFTDITADQPVVYTYSVEIDPPELEAPSPERHALRTRIEVLGEKTRVLLVSGGPSHEYRILRNLLQRDATIDVACWLLSADTGFPQDGDIHLEKLPDTREELEKWDVFVFLDPDSEKLDRNFCTLVAQQITESGAGMMWVCGEKFMLEAFRPDSHLQPLIEILPIVPDIDAAATSVGLGSGMPRAWPYELTPAGRVHPALRIAEERTASEALWSRLPGFHFAFPVARAKPAAQVLVEHRKPNTSDDPDGAHPLIAAQFVGNGRVIFSGTDDIYRWRAVFETAYDRFWVRGIRFLFEGKLAAGNSRLRLSVDEDKLELGQAIRITAEARTETFEPLLAPDLGIVVRAEDGSSESFRLAAVEGVPGRYETFVRPTTTGFFRIEPQDELGGRPVNATFQVVPAALEKEGPVDLAELAAIASVPGGVLVDRPADLAAALAGITSQTRIESFTSNEALWDAWWTVAALLSVLALEWWLRKRSNLL